MKKINFKQYKNCNKLTKKLTALDAMAGDGGYEEAYLGDHIRFKMRREGKRFWAGDNISEYVDEEQKEVLIRDAAEAFETVLDRLLIDRHNDPNSKGTAMRLAKMRVKTKGPFFVCNFITGKNCIPV